MKELRHVTRGIVSAVCRTVRKLTRRGSESFDVPGIKKAERSAFDRLRGANSLDNAFDQVIEEQSAPDGELWPEA